MVPLNVAVVPFSPERGSDETFRNNLTKVTAALQMQVIRDFAPVWDVTATVTPFFSMDQIPTGYLPIVLVDDLPSARHGVHYAVGGRPFALVKFPDPRWSLLASHELLELLSDPSGNRVIPGSSLKDGQGQVEYLLEICDPCQAIMYLIDGVLVSDFVTPDYYASTWTAGLRYSFTGKLTGPRDVADGGYITWRVPGTEEVWQSHGGPDKSTLTRLKGESPLSALSIREWVDVRDKSPAVPVHKTAPEPDPFADAPQAYRLAVEAAKRYGEALARDIGQLLPANGPLQPHADDTHLDLLDVVDALAGADDGFRTRYKANPSEAVAWLAKKKKLTLAFPPDSIPESATDLASPEVFKWIGEKLRKRGSVFGDPSYYVPGGPMWWLAALGGG